MKKRSLFPAFIFLLLNITWSKDYPGLPHLVTPEIVKSINRGLNWLIRNQGNDGSWHSRGGFGAVPVAMTSMAGLALLSAGSTPTRGPYALHIRKAVDYILRNVHPSGLIAAMNEEGRPMYGHGFATLFLSQVLGMEEDKRKQERIKKVLNIICLNH